MIYLWLLCILGALVCFITTVTCWFIGRDAEATVLIGNIFVFAVVIITNLMD